MTTALVAGATGHVGTRLVQAVAERGVDVRAVSRGGGEGVTAGDVADRESMLELLSGVDAAYYLVHSLGLAGEFGEEEGRAARTFAAAARGRGVGRIVYLGGIAHDDDLSPHLASRREVGEILRASGVPTIEFRTSIVVEAGSASFLPASALPEQLAELVPERARLAANLLKSLRHGTAVEDDAALRDFDVRPVGLSEAVAAALA